MLKSEFSAFHQTVGQTLRMKAAVRRDLKTRPFLSLDEFYISRGDP